MPITRVAPSPTGALHLGNARTFLINWLLARKLGWKIILRIEDLDGPRIKAGADKQAIDDLKWLGLDWDEGPIYQSTRTEKYRAAIEKLVAYRVVYPCVCSRSEIAQAASAPHLDENSSIYPGTCRGRFSSIEQARAATGRDPALRMTVPASNITINDQFHAPKTYHFSRDLGDVVIAKPDLTPAYQLAVVVDDADMGVTDVVRGDDLLDSTPWQTLLYITLDLKDRIPRVYHLPLITGPDGRRLAKRHGDTRLSYYRSLGVVPERILNLLARWSGIPEAHDLKQILTRFDLSKVPPNAITFTSADDAFLKGK